MAPTATERGPSEARRRMRDLLDRYAAAKRAGTATEELQAEMDSAVSALRRRPDRGEGTSYGPL